MTKRIGIIGNGVAGLQLAYALKQEFDVTLHHYEDPADIRQGRIRSTQVHFHPAVERAQRMPAVDEAPLIQTIHFSMGAQKLFVGRLAGPAKSVDQRLAFAAGMSDLMRQGVVFRKDRVMPNEIGSLAETYDLLIDATGKAGPLFPFPVEQELTPLQSPQRKCIVGYFTGVSPVAPAGVSITVLPGAGELFEIPAYTEKGPVTILFIEAVPEGPLDAFKGIKSAPDFEERMRATVQQHFPAIEARIHAEHFALVDHGAYLQTAITPVVRRPYAMHDDKLILGCGDSVILADPITGQGCNTASYCAEQLVATLLEHQESPWDEQVGLAYWSRIRPYVAAVTDWTNAMLGPMPGHIVQLLMQAAGDQETADRIAHWFEQPSSAYAAFFQSSERS
ncbi:styrene monooxygenase/indole monooxygenase family protein [Paenibacillus methanolicus]|uniref:2-polyprenyl-6-methoxyphenol hydroxylase-like FAD-dependent oxidoreductase n=1 Tax=Paenibacillus methanolicus TaxID=582686 RepID=A0A5S5C0U3_9BACL|nr:styrene monooxygenase/indole monooxygenase family protein [Paenibacillus methanolicus]TYP72066.1 2-polyprenyl-6-methoxyphenol hydroxylase-like FAD-dependent oxidoreductase [Paenibacillus methanolicus]